MISYVFFTDCSLDRVPIIGRKPLDLFKLYVAVVAHGGLIRVANNRLWEEVAQSMDMPKHVINATRILHEL